MSPGYQHTSTFIAWESNVCMIRTGAQKWWAWLAEKGIRRHCYLEVLLSVWKRQSEDGREIDTHYSNTEKRPHSYTIGVWDR